MRWRKFNGDPIELPIMDAVENAIKLETEKGFRLKVCIGTDSQVKGQETEFATVIVFLREGHGGFMFIHNDKTRQQYTIKETITVANSVSFPFTCESVPIQTFSLKPAAVSRLMAFSTALIIGRSMISPLNFLQRI